MNLNGDLGYNYSGSLDNGTSAHSMGFSGNANLQGSYYSPNFLNFNVQPYYDRAQSNSAFGALTNSSGVNSNLNLFSGSHFPGNVSYNKTVNGTSEFGFPESGIGLAQHGDNQGLAVSWSALLPNLPTLTATYAIGDGSSSIYGSQEENKQSDRSLALVSTYHIAGFRLAGGYTHRNVNSDFSEILAGITAPVKTNTDNDTYQFNGQHSFPMSGSYGFSWSRSSYGYNYNDSYQTHSSGTSDTASGNLAFHPMQKLTVAFNTNYTDSLLGSLPEPVLNGGTVVTSLSLGAFRSLFTGADAYYRLLSNLNLHGNVSHVHQTFLGKSYDATVYGGGLDYNTTHRFLGSFSFSLAAFESANEQGNNGLGFVGNLNFSRKFNGWDVNANVSYSQNVQTLVLVYTTSSYGWVANARKRLGNRTYFMAGYSGSHSGFSAQAGSSNSAERWSSGLTWRVYSANGFYSKSDGMALLTPTGLVSVPTNLPPGLFGPDSVITYGSSAYGFNLSATPIRRLTIAAGYANSNGSTIDPLISSFTANELYNAILQYKLRKIYVNGGYTRLRQSVGIAGTAPVTVTTYFIGVSRWFNFF
jgi:hypothetical protein